MIVSEIDGTEELCQYTNIFRRAILGWKRC